MRRVEVKRDATHRQPIMARGQFGYLFETYWPLSEPDEGEDLQPCGVYSLGFDSHDEAEAGMALRIIEEDIPIDKILNPQVIISTRKLVVEEGES